MILSRIKEQKVIDEITSHPLHFSGDILGSIIIYVQDHSGCDEEKNAGSTLFVGLNWLQHFLLF